MTFPISLFTWSVPSRTLNLLQLNLTARTWCWSCSLLPWRTAAAPSWGFPSAGATSVSTCCPRSEPPQRDAIWSRMTRIKFVWNEKKFTYIWKIRCEVSICIGGQNNIDVYQNISHGFGGLTGDVQRVFCLSHSWLNLWFCLRWRRVFLWLQYLQYYTQKTTSTCCRWEVQIKPRPHASCHCWNVFWYVFIY